MNIRQLPAVLIAAVAPASFLIPLAHARVLQKEWVEAAPSAAASGISGYELLTFGPGVDLVSVVFSNKPTEYLLINADSAGRVEYSYKGDAGSTKIEMEYCAESLLTVAVNHAEVFRAQSDPANGWEVILEHRIEDQVALHLLRLIYDLALDENLSQEVDVAGAIAHVPTSLGGCAGEAGSGSSADVPPSGPWSFECAGACVAPIWAGARVRFIGCTDLTGWCLMPESGCTLNCNIGTGADWHGGVDGLRAPWHGPGQWLKILGHCSLTIDCDTQTVSCCCNAFLAFVQRQRGKIPTCQEMDTVANPNDPNHAHCAVPLAGI